MGWGAGAKNVKGVFCTEKWVQKNCLNGCYGICFFNICEKHLLIGENCIQSLKKYEFCSFSSFFNGNLKKN